MVKGVGEYRNLWGVTHLKFDNPLNFLLMFRDRSRERKEREVKPRRMFDSDDETRENKRRQRRNRGSPDNAGITERRRVTDRLSRHTKDEEDEEGESNKRRERNKRYNERNLESERPDGWRETAGSGTSY